MTRHEGYLEDVARNALKRHIDEHGATTFAKMEDIFRKCGYLYSGERTVRLPGNDSIFLWHGWSEEACQLVFGLLEEGYSVATCHPVVYLVDGAIPGNFELARDVNRRYAKPRWLPCVWVRDEEVANGK